MITVHELRKLGYKVSVHHDRNIVNRNGNLEFDPRGGNTVVTLVNDGDIVIGRAACSKKDNYSKKLGVRIALGRLLKLWNKDIEV